MTDSGIINIPKLSLNRLFWLLSSLFILIVLLALFFTYKINYQRNTFSVDKIFRIKPGTSFTVIAENLEKDSLISSSFWFKVAAKIQGKDNKIISKSFIIKPGLNNLELLEVLTDPSLKFTVKITIPEGMTIRQIGKLSSRKFTFHESDFIQETQNDSLINILGLKGKVKNLEGFLFPDTYIFNFDITPREFVHELFNEFYKKVIVEKYGLKGKPDKLLRIITLASIVQGETQLVSEMPTVAGVYTNRILKRMRLEADPTVQYALPDGPKQRLLNEDLKVKSPYNTYLNYGLPPGPINNPGIKAIEGALNPQKHNYLFFVATGKGGHTFSSTYSEHLIAVKEYRKNVQQK
ncbi:MAG: endolytic transglycosylase MltG [Candidatus Kapaibacterium sp.]